MKNVPDYRFICLFVYVLYDLFHRIDRTYKLYYGGVQKRPDGQYSRPVLASDGKVMGHVSEASRKDVRNAVEAAVKAAAG